MSSVYLDQIEIKRHDAGSYRLSLPFAEGRNVEVRSSLSQDPSQDSQIVSRAQGQQIDIEGLPAAPRHYFHLRVDGVDSGVAADRHIPFEGTPNFRDFGGYRTADGRRVRWGQLYRSGVLSRLSTQDHQDFLQLNIGLVCDFRAEIERTREPSKLPREKPLQVELLPLLQGNHGAMLKTVLSNNSREVGVQQMAEAMMEINRDFALTQTSTYGRLLQLAVNTSAPMLIHCSAGKDRTGFGAALILSALGVPQAEIMRDYILTQKYYLAEKEAGHLMRRYELNVNPEIVMPMLEVRPAYLQAAFDGIQAEFGDMATYLHEALGFDAAAQRELAARLLI